MKKKQEYKMKIIERINNAGTFYQLVTDILWKAKPKRKKTSLKINTSLF
jgi:hypothetical protein